MENMIDVGQIVNTHGLRGEVKVVTWTDYPEVFEEIEFLYVHNYYTKSNYYCQPRQKAKVKNIKKKNEIHVTRIKHNTQNESLCLKTN